MAGRPGLGFRSNVGCTTYRSCLRIYVIYEDVAVAEARRDGLASFRSLGTTGEARIRRSLSFVLRRTRKRRRVRPLSIDISDHPSQSLFKFASCIACGWPARPHLLLSHPCHR